MRLLLPTLPLLPWLLMLGSCSSPPKPPSVDESSRRQANSAKAIELQTCRSELQNTRILASEASRAAEVAAFTAARLHERQQALASFVSTAGAASVASANTVFTVHFDFGSARASMPQDMTDALLTSARSAPLIVLRGRTDGITDAASESRIARQRAAAVRNVLVAGGIDAQRIRETFQPSGDHVADNGTPEGRSRNRRVEIEVYRVLPVSASAPALAAQ